MSNLPEPGGVRQLMTQYSTHPWLFVRPGGNWGDHLIYAGAESLANYLRLNWSKCDVQDIDQHEITARHCIYIHGSGGFNSWGSGRAFLALRESARRPVKLVVQGPQTTEFGNNDVKNRLEHALSNSGCERLVIFAREHTTLSILHGLKSNNRDYEVASDHDTALYLDANDVLTMAGKSRSTKERYNLVVSRKDDETLKAEECSSNFCNSITIDPAYYCKTFDHWLKVHLCAREIATNRLHSAILGSILGKPVTLCAGSYHKNRSVWEFSLAARGVKWGTQIPSSPSASLAWCPRRIRESYKVDRLCKWLSGVPLS